MNIFRSITQQPIIFLLLLLFIGGCQTAEPDAEDAANVSRLDTQLVLNNALLEQSSKQSGTVWKIKAENIVYSDDRQVATLNKVVGNLYQSDAIILKLSAEAGEVRDNGKRILLNGSVIASDPRSNSVIKTEAVEWRPHENLLLMPQSLQGTKANLQVSAKSGQYLTDLEQLTLQDEVVATSKQPGLRLDSDRLEWQIPQSKITSPGAIKLVHYDEQQTVTDKLISDRAELDLDLNQATLTKNIELISSNPTLQVATDSLTWNYQQRIGKSDRPIQIFDRQRQISLTGNQGEVNLSQQQAQLVGGVRAINQLKDSELYARQLTWNMNTEEVEAIGNIVYEQIEPKASLTGEKAIGTLGNNNIVVSSDGKQQVKSIIDN